MPVNSVIFKAYDIRGFFPEEINAQAAYTIARAFAEYLRGNAPKKELSIVVSADARPSSPELKKAVINGFIDEGVVVIDMGLTTTPLHYFGVLHSQADGGIMVTASHDTFRANGLKLTKGGGEPLADDMEVVKQIARRGIFKKPEKQGDVREQTFANDYLEFLLSHVDLSAAKKFSVVVDAGAGMTSMILPQLAKKLPFKTFLLNLDLAFEAAREPLNPIKEETLAELKNEVVRTNADFGVAFDPDGDRAGFVTKNARFFRADYVTAFIARELLKKNPGEAVLYDVRSSSVVRETIASTGGRAVETRVGHSFIKSLMRKENAIFAGELSGHFYFRDFSFMDSGLLAFLMFTEYLAASGKTSDEVLAEFEQYSSSGEISIHFNDKKDAMLEGIANHYKDASEIKWVDGVSIYYDDWWTNIRQSHTEPTPTLRFIVEARTPELLAEKLKEIKALVSA